VIKWTSRVYYDDRTLVGHHGESSAVVGMSVSSARVVVGLRTKVPWRIGPLLLLLLLLLLLRLAVVQPGGFFLVTVLPASFFV